jgi:hypothetical protein
VEEERVRKSDMINELEKTLLFEEVNWRQNLGLCDRRKGIITLNSFTGWLIRIGGTIMWEF